MTLGLSFANQPYDIKNLVTATKHKRFPIQRWVGEDILIKIVDVVTVNVGHVWRAWTAHYNHCTKTELHIFVQLAIK